MFVFVCLCEKGKTCRYSTVITLFTSKQLAKALAPVFVCSCLFSNCFFVWLFVCFVALVWLFVSCSSSLLSASSLSPPLSLYLSLTFLFVLYALDWFFVCFTERRVFVSVSLCILYVVCARIPVCLYLLFVCIFVCSTIFVLLFFVLFLTEFRGAKALARALRNPQARVPQPQRKRSGRREREKVKKKKRKRRKREERRGKQGKGKERKGKGKERTKRKGKEKKGKEQKKRRRRERGRGKERDVTTQHRIPYIELFFLQTKLGMLLLRFCLFPYLSFVFLVICCCLLLFLLLLVLLLSLVVVAVEYLPLFWLWACCCYVLLSRFVVVFCCFSLLMFLSYSSPLSFLPSFLPFNLPFLPAFLPFFLPFLLPFLPSFLSSSFFPSFMPFFHPGNGTFS